MGKQRGGSVLLGLTISIMLFYLVFYALIFWGLIRWYHTTSDQWLKIGIVTIGVAFIFGMYVSIFIDED